LLRGSPVVGIVANDEDVGMLGDCEGGGGRWASVAIAARYCITFLVLSVFPAPDSPLESSLKMVSYDYDESVRDQDALVLPFFSHVDPRAFGDCKYMGRIFIPSLVAILLYYSVRVKW
jgi:hypothetical protein